MKSTDEQKGYIRADLALANPELYPAQPEVEDWYTRLCTVAKRIFSRSSVTEISETEAKPLDIQ